MKLSNLLMLLILMCAGIYMPLSYAYTYKTTNKTDVNPATGQPFIDPVSGEVAIDPNTGKPYINPWTKQPDVGTEIQIIIPLAAADHSVSSKGIKAGQFENVKSGGWYSGYCLEDHVKIRPMCNGNPIPQHGINDCLIFTKDLHVAYYEYSCGINPLGSSFWGMMDYATGGATTIARMTAQLAGGGGGGSNIDVLTFISKSEDISTKALKNSLNLFLLTTNPKKLADELNNQLKEFRKDLSGAQKQLTQSNKDYEKYKKDNWVKAVKPATQATFQEGAQQQQAKVTQAQQAIDPLQQTITKLEGELSAIKSALDKNATAQQKQASSQAIQSIKEAAVHDAVLSARALRLAQGKGLPSNLELDQPATDNEIKIVEGTIGSSVDKAIKQIQAKLDDYIKSLNIKAKAAPTYTCRSLDQKAVEAQMQVVHYGLRLLQKIIELKLADPWSSLAGDPSFIKAWHIDNLDHLWDSAKNVADDFKKFMEKNQVKNGTVINPDLLKDAEQRLKAAADKRSNDDARYLGLRAIDSIRVMAELSVISAVRNILDLDGKKLPSGVTIGSPPTAMERDALYVIFRLPDEKAVFFLENIMQQELNSTDKPKFITETFVPSIQVAGLNDQAKRESIYSIVEKINDLYLVSQASPELIKAIIKAFPDKKKVSSPQIASALEEGDYTVLEMIPNEIVAAIKNAVIAAEGSSINNAVKNQTVIAVLGIELLKELSKLEIKDPGNLKQWGVNNLSPFIDTMKSTASKLKNFTDKNKNVGDFPLTHNLLDDAAKKLNKASDKNASEDDHFAGLQALDAIRIASEFSVIMAIKTILILDGKMLEAGTAISSAPTVKEQEALEGALTLSEDKIISLIENVVLEEVGDKKPPVVTDDSTSFFAQVKDLASKAKKAYDYYKKVKGFVDNVEKYAKAVKSVVSPSETAASAKGTEAVVEESSMVDTVAKAALDKLPDQVSDAVKNALEEVKGVKETVVGAVDQIINKAKGFATDLATQVVSKIEQSVVGQTAKELTAKAAQAIVEQAVKASVTKSVETAVKNATEEAQSAGKTLTPEALNNVTKQAVEEAANSAKNVITKVTNNAEAAGKIAQAISNVAEGTGRAAGEATGQAIGEASAEAIGKAAGSAAAEVAAELGAELASAAALQAVEIATGPVGVLVQLGSMVAVGLAGAFCAAAAFCGDHSMLVTRKPGNQMGFNVSIKGAC